MKKVLIASVAIIGAIVWGIVGMSDKGNVLGTESMNELSIQQEVESGQAVLLDVRTESEWDEGHATLAQLFDLTRMENGELPQIDKDKKIFLYCRSGRRADLAKTILQENGFINVTNLGGLEDVERLGLISTGN